MPQPTSREVYVDAVLTQFSVAYQQDTRWFIGGRAFPTVPVNFQTGKYFEFPRGFFYRNEISPRPLGGRNRTAGYRVVTRDYDTVEYGLAHPIDDRIRANAQNPFDPDRSATRFLSGQAMIHYDRHWVNSFFTSGVWTHDWQGVSAAPAADEFLHWSDEDSTPIRFLKQRIIDVHRTTGYRPNVLILGQESFLELTEHPDVQRRIQFVERAIVTEDKIAALVGVDEVLVPGAVENTAPEKADDADGTNDEIDFIAGSRDALLLYRNPGTRPTIEEPSAGLSFAWTNLIPGETNALGGVIERWRDDPAHSDLIEIRQAFGMKIVAPDLGVFIKDAVQPPAESP